LSEAIRFNDKGGSGRLLSFWKPLAIRCFLEEASTAGASSHPQRSRFGPSGLPDRSRPRA